MAGAGPDPGSALRDNAVFPGGTCLDVSFLRLPDPAGSYPLSSGSDANLTFSTLLRQLQQAGLQSRYKKYLVYVDGIGTGSDPICGTGEGEFDTGPAYALVWLPTCAPPGMAGRGRIACKPACGKPVAAGEPLSLRAVPVAGWTFVAWAGACRGSVPLCRPKTDKAVSVRARFAKKPVRKS